MISFDSPSRKLSTMLNVGLIGLGPEWEQRYRPALAKLRQRLRVLSVYSPVAAQAEQAAVELECQVAPGLLSLIEREDVRALLILDTAWHAGVPAEFACRVGKPAFLAGRFDDRLPIAARLLRRAAETGVTLMPDFGHRYTPATSRLRELVASRLGRPLSLVVETPLPADLAGGDPHHFAAARDALAVTLDWCTNLIGTVPAVVQAGEAVSREANAPAAAERPGHCELRVEFRRPAAGGEGAVAWIRLTAPVPESPPGPLNKGVANGLRARVQCAKGTAWLEGPRHVTWEAGAERSAETLTSDRPDVEVMLDHFSRRVVGGLIPVPTLDDLCRAYELVDSSGNASRK